MAAATKPNIFFFCGNDYFSMAEILREEKLKMEEKNKNTDINDFDFTDADNRFDMESKARDAFRSGSLFCCDKLTIVRSFWGTQRKAKGEKEEIAGEGKSESNFENFLLDYISKINPADKIFLVESRDLDRRGKAYKAFEELIKNNKAQKKEFVMPLGFRFNTWLENRIRNCGGKISKADLNYLALLLGRGMEQKERGGELVAAYDLYQAAGEIDKLISYCDGREIAREDISLLVSGREDMNIFNLIESIGRKDRSRALSILSGQIREGFNENYILTMLVYHFRNLINVKSLADEGKSASEIARITKMHPMVAEKNMTYCCKLKKESLVMIYEKLYRADISIKTGRMEPELALDILIAAI